MMQRDELQYFLFSASEDFFFPQPQWLRLLLPLLEPRLASEDSPLGAAPLNPGV